MYGNDFIRVRALFGSFGGFVSTKILKAASR